MYDHVSTNKKSPHYQPPEITSNLGVMFNGKERKADVCEFCVSEGWIRVHTMRNGHIRSERGKVLLTKLRGEVTVFDRAAV